MGNPGCASIYKHSVNVINCVFQLLTEVNDILYHNVFSVCDSYGCLTGQLQTTTWFLTESVAMVTLNILEIDVTDMQACGKRSGSI